MTPEQEITSLKPTVAALQEENVRLQHELEVRASSDGDTIRELRAMLSDFHAQARQREHRQMGRT